MREIKYECWYSGRMLPVGSLQLMSDGTFIVNDELPVLAGNIRQFIGLIDCAGKEMYEGDIVQYTEIALMGLCPLHKRIGEIVFYKGKACFAVEYMDEEYHYFGSDVFLHACKVIGNIYERAGTLAN